jgi:hypothetical protein
LFDGGTDDGFSLFGLFGTDGVGAVDKEDDGQVIGGADKLAAGQAKNKQDNDGNTQPQAGPISTTAGLSSRTAEPNEVGDEEKEDEGQGGGKIHAGLIIDGKGYRL